MSADEKSASLYAQFPRLTEENHRITSPPSDAYNCVAWASLDNEKWWEPGFFWPAGVPEPVGDEDIECYVELFRAQGYELCATPELEAGSLKIALYSERGRFHHVAMQLPSGRWSSKAGPLHDLRHDGLDLLEDAITFGRAAATLFMRRRYPITEESVVVREGELILLHSERAQTPE